MTEAILFHQLVAVAASKAPQRTALTFGTEPSTMRRSRTVSKASLQVFSDADSRSERVGIYLDKRFETVVACFGAAAAGGVFVPLNPLLKPEQVGYILRDCNVRVLVTSPERLASLAPILPECPDLRHVVVTGQKARVLATARRVSELIGWSDAARRHPPRPAIASSTSTWRRSSTPRAAPASRRAWCCPTATWSPARRASPPTSGTTPTTRCSRRCRCRSTPASAS